MCPVSTRGGTRCVQYRGGGAAVACEVGGRLTGLASPESCPRAPPQAGEWTGTFRDGRAMNPLGAQPENALTGARAPVLRPTPFPYASSYRTDAHALRSDKLRSPFRRKETGISPEAGPDTARFRCVLEHGGCSKAGLPRQGWCTR